MIQKDTTRKRWPYNTGDCLHLYYEVIFGTKKKWSFKTGDVLQKVQFVWIFLRRPINTMSESVTVVFSSYIMETFKYRWLLNRGDLMSRFDLTICLNYCANMWIEKFDWGCQQYQSNNNFIFPSVIMADILKSVCLIIVINVSIIN